MLHVVMHKDPEILTSLCKYCKCCLAVTTHCWNCHIEMDIEDLCGCGDCSEMARDFLERKAIRDRNRKAALSRKSKLKKAS